MKYRFSLDETSIAPERPYVEFEAKDDAAAYRYVVSEILNVEENGPLKQGTLYLAPSETARVPLMIWRRGPGWSFPSGHARGGSGMIDERIAPGA